MERWRRPRPGAGGRAAAQPSRPGGAAIKDHISQWWACCGAALQRQTLLANSSRTWASPRPIVHQADRADRQVCNGNDRATRAAVPAAHGAAPRSSSRLRAQLPVSAQPGCPGSSRAPCCTRAMRWQALGLHQIRGGHHDLDPLSARVGEHCFPKSRRDTGSHSSGGFIRAATAVGLSDQGGKQRASLSASCHRKSRLAQSDREGLQTPGRLRQGAAPLPPELGGHQPAGRPHSAGSPQH